MSKLHEAMNNTAVTWNGAAAHHSTLNANLDLFFQSGASRGKDITHLFAAAIGEDEKLAIRCLQWLRDVRGGAGERQQFRNLVGYLLKHRQSLVLSFINKIPELGRWDDLLIFHGTQFQKIAFDLIAIGLAEENGLCAKWMPRPIQQKKDPERHAVAKSLAKHLNLTPKQYRKMLVRLSNTVEQKMTANEWTQIEYGKLPSLASARYSKAFNRHDPVGYSLYMDKVEGGEDKINAGAVYPYDVVKNITYGESRTANEQWKALPDYMEGNDENILCMIDTSGSMSARAGGRNSTSVVTCKDVAFSLGLYISERTRGLFKDQFLSFSARPNLHKVSGSLSERYHQVDGNDDWNMNTNLEKAFETILNAAIKNNIPESEMPDKILILSDMQFDSCTSGYDWKSRREVPTPNKRLFDRMKELYDQHGYTAPQVVFWNINSSAGNVPVTMNEAGVALVSGFSPTILENLLGGELDPIKIMLRTLENPRYDLDE